MTLAALAVGTPGLAQESGAAAKPADRGASVLDRLRRRDPAAALKKYSGRWRRTGTPAPLRPPLAALPVLRQRGEPSPEAAAERELDLDDLDLDLDDLDLDLDDLDLDLDDLDLDLDDLDLPDDLKLDSDVDGGAGQASGDGDEADALTPKATRPARRPRDLKGIRDILPFGDYDPDPDPLDPCRNLCPRPAGCPPVDAAEGDEGDGDGEAGDEAEAGDGDDRSRDTAAYCPEITPLSTEPYVPRSAAPLRYRWAASNIAYNPLYFQDVNLERYGHNYGLLQPAVSAGKFGVQLIGLPYQMALDHPHKCVTPLGYYRPGDCAPKLHYQIPLNLRAAVVQAAAVSGIAIIIP